MPGHEAVLNCGRWMMSCVCVLSLRRHARPTAKWALPLIVMPGLVPGIHVLRPSNSKDVDGRDKAA